MVSSTAFTAALASTGLISLAPNLILLAFPQYATPEALQNSYFLSMGQAMAAGGLLGDVFLHTLSHAVDYEGEQVGLWLLLGFTIFLVMDVVVRSVEGKSSHHHDSHASENGKHSSTPISTTTSTDTGSLFLSSSVLLNLTGDALHNFTDGLAIGASFASHAALHHGEPPSIASLFASRGGLAAISILFHEIPHELGDYCILVKGGFTKLQAILAQFITAIAAFLGTLLGLWAAVEGGWGEKLIYVTAGGFVYLASTTILPQLLDEAASPRLRLTQLCAFVVGIVFMYAVSLLEDEDEHHGHGHHQDHSSYHDHDHHDHEHHHDHEL